MHRRTESNVSRIGLLTSELGYEHETFIDRLPTDNIAYSIRSPDEAVRLGLEFVTKMLEEVRNMLIRLTPKHTIGSLAAKTRCRHARRCLAPRGSALSGFTARVPTPLS